MHTLLKQFLGTMLCFSAMIAALAAEEERGPRDDSSRGPDRGSLLIVGGGAMDESIRQRFVDLAGGAAAEIVVIPTASGDLEFDDRSSGAAMWTSMGVARVTMLHTYDRAEADTDEFIAPLKTATGVWFGGGRQWRLADSYLNTKTHEALNDVLEREGVIGGSSAGATIQGSYLARGDSKTNVIMMGDHEEGLAFLKNVAIDQHVLARNRQFDMLEIIEARPEILGIGIDEATAIVVQGNEFEVIGRTYVAVYDAEQIETAKAEGQYFPFYLLGVGQRFDLLTRQPIQRRTALNLR